MLFHGKSILEIEENDLFDLIGTSTENQAVDFKKLAYPPVPDSALERLAQADRDRLKNKWKLDLCTDLTALANAQGGWIICGMKENGGTATELCGLGSNVNAEQEIARLEQCASTGIEPMLSRLKIQAIELQSVESAKAIVFHVPRSFRAPHRVRETSKFHIRRSGRNDEMNIDELRAAFNLSESVVIQTKTFRKERIEALAQNRQEEIPVHLPGKSRLVLHIIPLTFFEPSSALDLSAFRPRNQAMWVYDKHLDRGRFNLDGYVKPSGESGYIQIYRNGIVECVEVIDDFPPSPGEHLGLYSLEDYTLYLLDIVLNAQKNLGVQPPFVILLSLVGVKDRVLVSGSRSTFEDSDYPPTPLIQNNLLIPDTLFEDYTSDCKAVMKPIFDILWNAAGRERSRSYHENGSWVRRENY